MADSFLNIKLKSKGNILSVQGQQLIINKNFEKRLTDKEFMKKDLVLIAEMIKEKIESNILQGKTYRGSPVAKLKPSTIKRKGHARPLFETGTLSKSVMVDRRGGAVTVRLKKVREEIGGYLQEGTKYMKARPFFGITQKDLNAFVKRVFTLTGTRGSFKKVAYRKGIR